MEPFQTLKLNESGVLQLFDRNWSLVKTIPLDQKIPMLSKGINNILFGAEFTGEGGSKFKIEIRTVGEAESVKAK